MPLKRNALSERASLYPLSFDNFPIIQRTPTRGRQSLTRSYSPRNRSRSNVDHSYEGILLQLKVIINGQINIIIYIYIKNVYQGLKEE